MANQFCWWCRLQRRVFVLVIVAASASAAAACSALLLSLHLIAILAETAAAAPLSFPHSLSHLPGTDETVVGLSAAAVWQKQCRRISLFIVFDFSLLSSASENAIKTSSPPSSPSSHPHYPFPSSSSSSSPLLMTVLVISTITTTTENDVILS